MTIANQSLLIDRSNLRWFQHALLRWYGKHHRDLPWRKKPTLYRVWLSEVMLQQTQVETVVPYFKRFVKTFPNVKRLAEAPLDDVLKHWEGLGYYRRARSLHAAAIIIRDQFRGRFPRTYDELIQLPGIGRYTAGAILSIATDARLPILEGNTLRLFSRLLNLDDDVGQSTTQRTLWQFAESILPRSQCGTFNQALMELGNQVCRPSHPGCLSCPAQRYCQAFSEGTVDLLPITAAKRQTSQLFESLFVIRRHGKMLLRKCQPGERWQGLYDFPRMMNQSIRPNQSNLASFVLENVVRLSGSQSKQIKPFWKTVHHVTRYKIKLFAYEIDVTNDEDTELVGPCKSNQGFSWYGHRQIERLPLNKTAREAYKLLSSK